MHVLRLTEGREGRSAASICGHTQVSAVKIIFVIILNNQRALSIMKRYELRCPESCVLQQPHVYPGIIPFTRGTVIVYDLRPRVYLRDYLIHS